MASQPQVLSRRELAALTREAAVPSRSGPRQVWRGQSVAIGLTPQRLAAILLATYDTDYQHYDLLTLAEEIEERDPHYAGVLGVRKNALLKLEGSVEAASDGALDVDLADVVRRLTRKPEFSAMVFDLLDAIGKGYSVVEIIWDRSGPVWTPARYEWRDPRFFAFDRIDPEKLLLLDEYGNRDNGAELEPFKWIVHKPHLKSGIPIRAGLARLVALSYMAKSYAIADWLAFSEVFGMPLRLGRYGEGASEEDINKLIRAVACLGTDAAAAIPDTMSIEFVEPSRGGGGRGGRGGEQLFERLAMYLDKQVSKAVLGQTMTTDDGSSKAQARVHNQVRLDILKSDARQLEATINRDLVKPFIDLNFGPQKDYPRFVIPVKRPVDIRSFSNMLAKLVPLGLGVQASVARDRLGLPEPENAGDLSTLLKAPAKPAPAPLPPDPDDDGGAGVNRAAAEAERPVQGEELKSGLVVVGPLPLAGVSRGLFRKS